MLTSAHLQILQILKKIYKSLKPAYLETLQHIYPKIAFADEVTE